MKSFGPTAIKALIGVLCVILLACEKPVQTNNNFKQVIKNPYELKTDSLVYFDVDSLTPYYSSCIQFAEVDDKPSLIIFNSTLSNIDFYTFGTPRLQTRMELRNNTAIDNIKYYDGVHYHSNDSIFLVSSAAGKVCLVSDSQKVIRMYDIHASDSNNYFSSPTVGSTSPLVKDGNTIFINGLFGERIDPFGVIKSGQIRNLLLRIDLHTGMNVSSVGYPASYEGNFWGPHMMSYYTAYNPIKKQIVYSFPANHNVVCVSLDGSIVEFQAGSVLFDEIHSMNKDQIPNEARNKYYLSNPSYGPIYYDKYRHVFYRIANNAITDEELESGDTQLSSIKPTSIIILDENFKLLGETVLPRFSYTETMAFVAPDGLYVGDWDKSKLDESKIYFSRFRLVQNEKPL